MLPVCKNFEVYIIQKIFVISISNIYNKKPCTKNHSFFLENEQQLYELENSSIICVMVYHHFLSSLNYLLLFVPFYGIHVKL